MGPLAGIKVIELGGEGPVSFCGMMLADMGASVVRLEPTRERYRIGQHTQYQYDVWYRGHESLRIDLKHPSAQPVMQRLIKASDMLIEGFRPGVAERLGLGPAECLAVNPGLVYGRVTGWGQDGPLAHSAGHDINYSALTGVLNSIGAADGPPVPPLNLAADLGGGGLMLAFGLLCALIESRQTGCGQVVDTAMIDGAGALMAQCFASLARGHWSDSRGGNLIDGGRPWYGTYETRDGKYVAVGPLEPKFYRLLIQLIGLDQDALPDRDDPANWPEIRRRLADAFKRKDRVDWCALLEGTDACFAPVLSLAEMIDHPHVKARSMFVEVAGVVQPRPAPRFSRTQPDIPREPPEPGRDTREVLAKAGFSASEIDQLFKDGAVA